MSISPKIGQLATVRALSRQLGPNIEAGFREEQHQKFSLHEQKEFLNVPVSRPFEARGLSSAILQERVLIVRPTMALLGRKLLASGTEYFHHAGLKRERG